MALRYRADLGESFRSGWEANYARYMNWLIKNDKSDLRIISWEYEPETYKYIGGQYTPDFIVMYTDLHTEVHEVKGRWQGERKLQRYIQDHDIPVKLICNPNTKKMRSKLSNGSWWVKKDKFKVEVKVIDYIAIKREMEKIIPYWE